MARLALQCGTEAVGTHRDGCDRARDGRTSEVVGRPARSGAGGRGDGDGWYAPRTGGAGPRLTIRTPSGRTMTPVAPARTAAEPLIVAPGTIAPGRARPAAPARREGPAKLTGEAKYADDLVFPGAWYGATIRSTDAHARFDGYDLGDGVDWSKVAVVSAADIPGENVVSLISDDQPVLVPIGGEIQHQAE